MGGRTSSWFDRCKSLLVPHVGCIVVRADSSSGIQHVISEIRSIAPSIIWLKLDEYDTEDPISVGNKFAEAFGRSHDSTVFGHGVPIGHTINKLLRFQSLFNPMSVFVSSGDLNTDAVGRIRVLADHGSSVCIVVPESTPDALVEAWSPNRLIHGAELQLSLEEALEIASGALPPDAVESVLRESGGRFVNFVSMVRETAGLPPLLEPEPHGFSMAGGALDDLPAGLLISALRRRGASVEAFEVCVRLSPQLAGDIVREAAPQYVGSGMTRRLLRQLELLPANIREASDDLLRWWFAALTAENRHVAARPVVERVLSQREAPELRALYAAAFPGPDMVSETERAVLAIETPVTLRMHGFALGQQSTGDVGIGFLMRALRMAEALGDVDQVVASATEISNFYTRKGHYRDGAEWAHWAVDQYYAKGGKDEIRRLAAMSLLAYVKILTDDLIGIDTLIDEIDVSDELLGMPTTEGMVSTLGDWYAAEGDLDAAERLYRRNLETLPREHFHLTALDLIPVLKKLGRHAEARIVGGRARTLTRESDAVTRALGTLAFALSEADSGSSNAEEDLAEVVRALGTGSEAHRLAQAAIALAQVRLRRDDVSGATRALREGEVGIRELGPSGWRLLTTPATDVPRLRSLYNGDGVEIQLFVLGAASVKYGHRDVHLTVRNAECLAILAERQDGLSLEQLSIHLYGERASLGTTKALVSRLRGTIPLTSRPYKIGVPYRADFLDLLEHLKGGRVRQALTIYRGPLLPQSEAPTIVSLREHIDESLRQAVLGSGDAQAMLELANRTHVDDLELLEEASRHLPKNDPQSPLLRARIRQIRREWGEDGRLSAPAEW